MKLSFFIFRMPDLMHALSSTCYIYKLFNLLEVKEIINSFFGGKCVKAAHPLPFPLSTPSLSPQQPVAHSYSSTLSPALYSI